MQQRYTRYQNQGLVVLGVDEQEDAARVLAFVQPRALTWPFLLDADGAVARNHYLTGLPLHVFVDAAGIIRAVAAGESACVSTGTSVGISPCGRYASLRAGIHPATD